MHHSFSNLVHQTFDPHSNIVENGLMNRQAMRENLISDHDLEEDLRLAAETEDLAKIKIARLERSGDISFIKREST